MRTETTTPTPRPRPYRSDVNTWTAALVWAGLAVSCLTFGLMIAELLVRWARFSG